MNKIQRMQAVFNNETPDYVPSGFWFHYPSEWEAEATAKAHLELYRSTDMDIIKIMDDCFGCAVTENLRIEKAADWRSITLPGRSCNQYKKMEKVIKTIVQEAGSEVMVFPTMWSPFKIADFAYVFGGSSEAEFMKHCKEDSESVLAGLETITNTLMDWAEGYMAAGASGIYYSGQFSEPQRFTEEEWKKLVMPWDLKVLNRIKTKGGYNIVHICGESEFDFATSPARYKDYPGDMFNWAVHHNNLSLQEGRELFKKPILGGLNNHGTLLKGPVEGIVKETKEVIDSFGKKGFMLGADCTVSADINLEHLRAAIKTAVEHK